jgi:hypothetical protein
LITSLPISLSLSWVGSILDSLGEIIEHPGNMLAILAMFLCLNNVIGHFATFIMKKIFAGLTLKLLQFRALIWLVFVKLCFCEKTNHIILNYFSK